MTDNSLRDDLQRQIDRGKVVAIVGAGLSVGATKGNPVASWQGLLHHGVDRCLALPTGVTDETATFLRGQIDSGDLDMMLAAAEVISRKLGAPGGGEWRIWLRETVGQLRAEQRGVIEALRNLGVTIATTNYDGLIEEVTGLQPVTWRDGAIVERVLRGEEEGVLHLHGFWKDPESVILGVQDYAKVLGDAHAQAMQQAMRSVNTLLFVGCGEGLHDPNFGALLKWTARVFAESEYRQFRLSLDDEVVAFQARHPDEQRIMVLGYGPKHDDLPSFLRGLQPSTKTGAPSPSVPSPAPGAALPPAPICFGRDAEIDDLVATLLADKPEPLSILGPAGIGKSTITLVALNDARIAERYGPRRYFIRCDAVRTREAFAAVIATALGLPIGPQVEVAVLTALASAPAALAIDNAETPWEADTLRVEELFAQLTAVPGLALIASLRGYSRPMGVRWRQAIEPRSLPLEDARKVFLAIAGQQFTNDPDLDRLLRALDGVPLAITLMANAAEGQPDLADTWERWERERTKMLQRAGGTDRLLNIEVSYEISIQGPRMTDEARRLLSILGFLPGGVARSGIEAVFPGHGTRAAAVLRQVGLVFDEAHRLRLLAPLREYVQREHLPNADDLQIALSYFLGLAISLGNKPGHERGAEAVVRLTPEAENIDKAIVRVLDGSDNSTAIEAAIAFGGFARHTGLGRTIPLEKALVVAKCQGADELAAQCCLRLGTIADSRSDYETARAHNEEALLLFARVDNIRGQAYAIQSLGDISRERSEKEAARAYYEKSLALYRRVTDIAGEANCIFTLGQLVADSDQEAARSQFEEALPLYRRSGAVLGEGNCIFSLADLSLARGEHEMAHTGYSDALALYRGAGSLQGEANCIRRFGDIAHACSDHEVARARYQQALALYERISEPFSIGWVHWKLAGVAADERQRRRHVDAARDAWQSIERDDLVAELIEEFGVE